MGLKKKEFQNFIIIFSVQLDITLRKNYYSKDLMTVAIMPFIVVVKSMDIGVPGFKSSI